MPIGRQDQGGMIPIAGGAIVPRLDLGMVLVVDPSRFDSAALDAGLAAEPAAPPPAFDRSAVTWRSDLRPHTTLIRLQSRIAGGDLGLAARLAGLAAPPPHAPEGAAHCLDLTAEADGYGLWCDGTFLRRVAGRPDLIGAVYGAVLELTASPRRLALQMHAAAVVVDGVPLVLGAPSGGGKTTLTLGLAKAGAEVLSDDTVGLMEDDLSLVGLAASMRVRDGGWPTVAPLLGPHGAALVPDGAGIRHVPPRLAGEVRVFSPPAAAVLLLDYRPGAACRWEPMAAAEGLALLVQAGAALPRDPAPTAPAALARWCSGTRFLRLTYGSLDDGVRGVFIIRSALVR